MPETIIRTTNASKPFKLKGKSSKTKTSKVVIKSKPKNTPRSRTSAKTALAENPYLETLLDPFNTAGAKVPDDQCYLSAPFTLTRKFALSANTYGVIGLCIGQARDSGTGAVTGALVPQNSTVTAKAYVLGQTHSANSTTSNLFIGTVGNTDWISYDQWSSVSGKNAVQTAFDQCRLVSMGIAGSYTGAPLQAKGRITIAYTPKNMLAQTAAIDLDTLQAVPGSKVIPINELDGALALYKPVDYSNWTYKSLTTYHDLSTAVERDDFCDGALWIVADGLDTTAGVATMQFVLTAHYEGLPKRSTWSLVEVSPSPHDPLQLASAMNIVQETPSTLGTAAPALDGIFTDKVDVFKLTNQKEKKKSKSGILSTLESGIKTAFQMGDAIAPLASLLMKTL